MTPPAPSATFSPLPKSSAALLAALLLAAAPAARAAGPLSGGPVSGGPVSGGPVSSGPLVGGAPLSGGPVKADFGLAPQPVAPKEEDFWLSETMLQGRGTELKINTSFDWSKVKAVSGGPVGAQTPGTLERPHWLAYPWQELPFVEITPFRGQSKPGGKNFSLYKEWEARALAELPPLAPTNMNGKKWVATSALGAQIRSPIAQCQLTFAANGTVRGSVWIPKRRVKPPPGTKNGKDYVIVQQIPVTGQLLGSTIRLDAAGLHAQFDLVGKGYGLKGEFAGKPVDSLISPHFQEAWKTVQAATKKPVPVPTKSKTSYGAEVTRWE